MAYTIQVYQYFVAKYNGRVFEGGKFKDPQKLVLTGNKLVEKSNGVATETTWDALDVVTELGGFDFLWIQSDRDVMIELVTDDGGEVGEMVYTMEVKGTGVTNKPGPAFFLASDDSYAGYTVDFAGGTLDKIEYVRIRNLSDTYTANVFLVAGT